MTRGPRQTKENRPSEGQVRRSAEHAGKGTSPAVIPVRVKPRSSREAVEGWVEGALVVRLTSPPVDGAANNALVRLVAKKLGVALSRVRIRSGERGRHKVLEVEGLTQQAVREVFP